MAGPFLLFLELVKTIVLMIVYERCHNDPFCDWCCRDTSGCSDGDGRMGEQWVSRDMVRSGAAEVYET